MKVVRIAGGVVQEIIPKYALPAEKWYGVAFAAQCVEAPDEVDQRWVFDQETGTFSPPGPTPHEYTDLELAQQEITEQALSIIEQGQLITDLELSILSKE